MDIEEQNEKLKEEADAIKVKGNDEFKNGKYLQAIEHYTKAIGNSPLTRIFIGFRSLCKGKELLREQSGMFSKS